MRFTFPKSEKLKQKTAIDALFKAPAGNIKVYPLLFLFKQSSEHSLVKVGVSVSKRKFKKAVDRNRIKRQMREAYRLSKPQVAMVQGLDVMVIFIAKDKIPSSQIHSAMQKGLDRLVQQLATP